MSWFELPWQVIVWIVLVTMLAGYVQGLLGVGYPMLATPLLALFIDLTTAMIVTVPTVMLLAMYLIFRGGGLRESVLRFWYMPLCMLAGSWVGAKIFFSVDPAWLLLALGAALLMYVSLDWLGRTEYRLLRAHPHPLAVVCGCLAGVSESAINVGGPFLLVWCLLAGIAPVSMIQILNLCFLSGKTMQVLAFTASGVPASAWLGALPLVVVAGPPFLAGLKMRERADVAAYRRWLRTFLGLMALLMVLRFAALAFGS